MREQFQCGLNICGREEEHQDAAIIPELFWAGPNLTADDHKWSNSPDFEYLVGIVV